VVLTAKIVSQTTGGVGAEATISLGAAVLDVNESRLVGTVNPYTNTSDFGNQNGTMSFNVTDLVYTLNVYRTLSTAHVYEILTWVTVETDATVSGPRSTASSASAEVTFSANPAGAALDLISY
jgi:hypothetical protein